jgi:hypothetical protein
MTIDFIRASRRSYAGVILQIKFSAAECIAMKKFTFIFITAFYFLAAALPSSTAAPQKATAIISGEIQHPSHKNAAVKVCVVSIETRKQYCIKTKPGQANYQIKKLPAGEYQVFADDLSYAYEGGYMQSVQCIRAPCDPVPGNIVLAAGQHFDKAMLSLKLVRKLEAIPFEK